MEKEISSGTMLGIVLIALAAVIGLGFGVFSIAKGVANEGTVGVQDNLEAVSGSAFEDYNDKIVTGTMVKSAVQNFAGKSVAIFINTNAMDVSVKTYGAHANINIWELNATKFKAGTNVTGNTDASPKAITGTVTAENAKKVGAGYFVNYNALLEQGTTGTGTGGATSGGPSQFDLKDGVFVTDAAFKLDANTGKVAFDNTVGGFSRTGNCEYLSPSAKFTANLIKDTSGTTIGIVFEQQVK